MLTNQNENLEFNFLKFTFVCIDFKPIAMTDNIYQKILNARRQGRKLFAVLIDPDKMSVEEVVGLVKQALLARVDLFLVGGSLVVKDNLAILIRRIKAVCEVPVLLFPGSILQITEEADALLFLSLISGRNPDLLIGQQVVAAPILKQMELEVISTGYMIVDGGKPTTASYITHSVPIPHDKPAIAACTAMAGELLGMKIIYLDTGSGAEKAVSEAMLQQVRKHVDAPIIVGGGIRTPEMAVRICKAGADVIVVGTAIEKDEQVMFDLVEAVHSINLVL